MEVCLHMRLYDCAHEHCWQKLHERACMCVHAGAGQMIAAYIGPSVGQVTGRQCHLVDIDGENIVPELFDWF